MRFWALVAAYVLFTGCSAQPTATSYKQQLAGGTPAPATGASNDGTKAGGGDPAKGKTALAASCDSCHASGSPGHKLTAADAPKVADGTAAKNANHSALASVFTNSGKDIAEFLKGGTATPTGTGAGTKAGDAAAGAALLKAKCEGCHIPAGGGVGPTLDATITSLKEKASVTTSHAGLETNFSGQAEADILAELKNRT